MKRGGFHVVLKVGDLYADNWTKAFVTWEEMEEKCGHKKYLWMYDPILVILKMFASTLKKSSRGVDRT